MSHSSLIVAAVVGFIQGFVAYATTVNLSKKLGDLVMNAAGSIYDPLRTEARPSASQWIARGISFAALVVLHIVVIEVVLSTLSQRNPGARFELGRIALIALIVGLAVSRLLPEIESRIRRRKS